MFFGLILVSLQKAPCFLTKKKHLLMFSQLILCKKKGFYNLNYINLQSLLICSELKYVWKILI